MMRAQLAIAACLVLLACKHDYDALQRDLHTDIRDAGGSGGRSGSGGSGGSGAGGGGGSGGSRDGGEPLGACAPCDELSDGALELGLVACCYGPGDSQCGLALGEDTQCHPRDVAGIPSETCPDFGPASARRAGCCRADSRCGVMFEGVGLGCVAREDIPMSIAPLVEPIACRHECVEDSDCDGVPGVTAVCVPDRDQRDQRFCAERCDHDGDCASGLVCGLSPDLLEDRLVAFCQEPFGEIEPPDPCDRPEDCEHRICILNNVTMQTSCSHFCRAAADCADGYNRCVSADINRPSQTGTPHRFSVCTAGPG
jgi:hypothetical protein